MTLRTAPGPAVNAGPAPLPRLLPYDRILTDRRLEFLIMAANGMTNAGIARALQVTEETVKSHFRHIYAILGARDRANAVALAIVRGLIRPDQITLPLPRETS